MADGGPHQLAINNGTQGLSGDCAACHRAHTAQAESMLKQAMPGLCVNCHNGTGATTDVVDGYQYTPDGSGNPTATVLGALRGGGFSYTLIDSADAVRQSIGGTQTVTINGAPTGGTFTLTFNGQTTSALAYNATANQVRDALFQLSSLNGGVADTTYTGSTAAAYMSSTSTYDATVSLSGSKYTITFQNRFRLAPQPLITANAAGLTGGTSPSIAVVDTTQGGVRQMAAIPALASTAKVATTSTHSINGAAGTVWGNGASGTVGTQGVVLNCAQCHNPHGNGQYRILQTTPGEDFSSTGNVPAASTTLAADVNASATTITVASATGFPASGKYTITVGSELMQVTAGQGTTTWTVTRGWNSTTAAGHTNGDAVGWVNAWAAPGSDVEVKDITTASTTFSAAVSNSVTSVTVASAAKFPSSGTFTVFVDAEQMLVTGGQGTTTWTVTRGANGTTAAAHTTTAAVFTNALVTGQVRNYTVKAGTLTTDVSPSGTGDYWRYKYDPSGTVNWTNFYLAKDDMNVGWNGTAPTNAAANGGVPPANSSGSGTGLMTAWCVQCHTRYSTAASLSNGAGANADTGDPTFTVRHSTSSSVGCEQCHVSHGTSAAMTAQFSSQVTFPDGSLEDSALLKLPNRGTCNMCHDPTKTVPPGTAVGATSTIPLTLSAKY